jgi:EpsI family protein
MSNPSSVLAEKIVRAEGIIGWRAIAPIHVIFLLVCLLSGGVLINYFHSRTEIPVVRKPLTELPLALGGAFRPYDDSRFSPATEEVLRASDYIMRDYVLPPRRFNLYVGYYASQQTGATYHSPQHCLPGSGWEMKEGKAVEFKSPRGRLILANRYLVMQGAKQYVMLYWYQGRGRTNSSEYWDKIYTVVDSVSMGRSDGAMVRVMTPIYSIDSDEQAFEAAKNFSGTIADSLSEFVPD